MPEFFTRNEEETKTVAANLAKNLKGDEVILIYGPLAVGKTVFVKGLARGLKIDENLVSSPTFTVMNIYSGGNILFHIDLYRIEEGELEFLAIEDFIGMGVIAVEWGEKAEKEAWAKDSIKVSIEAFEEGRKIVINRGKD